MKNKNFLLRLSLFAILFLSVATFAAEKSLYNPHPLPNDLVLPMPNGAEMVFRPVIVPGSNFWGDSRRIIELGTNVEDMFSSKQKSLVNGSFPSQDGTGWLIWIAKYELTQGQYVAVMGTQALLQNSGYERNRKPGELPYAELSGRKLQYEQTKPLAWVSYSVVSEFIHHYNRWLFDPEHPERLEKIPKIESVPGFIRLPTEEEWEFSARGGIDFVEDGRFTSDFPFPDSDLRKYAYTEEQKIRSIDNKKLANPLGIHGLYGNVQEMVSGVFRPEMIQGKPGGVIIRGGAYNSGSARANPALRTEMDLYRWDPDNQRMIEEGNYVIGARLAIGSNVIANQRYIETVLKKDWKSYSGRVKPNTPVGQNNQSLVGQASSQLDNIIDGPLRRIVERHPDELTVREAKEIQQNLNKASVRLEQAQHKEARSIAQDAARNAANVIELMRRADFTRQILDGEGLAEDLKEKYQNILEENKKDTALQMQGYISKLEELGQYKLQYQESAIKKLNDYQLSLRESYALELVSKHIAYLNREHKVSRESWKNDFQQFYGKYKEEFIKGE